MMNAHVRRQIPDELHEHVANQIVVIGYKQFDGCAVCYGHGVILIAYSRKLKRTALVALLRKRCIVRFKRPPCRGAPIAAGEPCAYRARYAPWPPASRCETAC